MAAVSVKRSFNEILLQKGVHSVHLILLTRMYNAAPVQTLSYDILQAMGK